SLACFPRSSSFSIPPEKWSIQDFINTAKSTWRYITQLNHFVQTLDMSVLLTRKLLGVEQAERSFLSTQSSEDVIVSPGFLIYSTSLLFDRLQQLETTGQSVSTPNSVLNVDFLTATEFITQKLALDVLYSMLRTEIARVHEAAASPSFQALYPCLEYA